MKVPVVRLKLRVRLPDGSRQYLDPNKKLKPRYALLDGKAVHFSDGVYHLRYVKGIPKCQPEITVGQLIGGIAVVGDGPS